MTRPHPATIALSAIIVVAAVGLWWFASALQETQRGLEWSGEAPPPEVMLGWAFLNFSYSVAMPAFATAAAASALGLVLIWCLGAAPDRQRSTRMMSAAGSTEKRAAVTMPNSSPSISNS